MPRIVSFVRALGLLVCAASVGIVAERMSHLPSSAAVDLLPLWLGGRAWIAGRDPNDPAVLQAMFQAAELRMRVGGFFSYYPPTAAVLSAPLAMLDFKTAVTVWRWCALVAMAGGLWLASGRRWMGAWVVALLFPLRLVWIVLPQAQPGPIVLFWTSLALWGLARARTAPTALGLLLGTATKLVPAAMVPALVAGRRWRALGLAAAGGLVLLLAVMARVPGWSFGTWTRELTRFVDAPPFAPWRMQEPAWVLQLWAARTVTIPLTVGIAALASWRRRVDVPLLGALGVAAVGLVMAGSHHHHEALVLLPAVAWALGRSVPMALWTLGLLFGFGVYDRAAPPSALHWVPVGWGLWLGLGGAALRRLGGPRGD